MNKQVNPIFSDILNIFNQFVINNKLTERCSNCKNKFQLSELKTIAGFSYCQGCYNINFNVK